MKKQELNQEQHLRIYQRPGYVQCVEKEKRCLKCINRKRGDMVGKREEKICSKNKIKIVKL